MTIFIIYLLKFSSRNLGYNDFEKLWAVYVISSKNAKFVYTPQLRSYFRMNCNKEITLMAAVSDLNILSPKQKDMTFGSFIK